MVSRPYTENTSSEYFDWRSRAACLTVDPELFFPVQSNDTITINRAKEVCGRCVVQQACLQFALETDQKDGIWGGRTETERRALKRRNFLANHATR